MSSKIVMLSVTCKIQEPVSNLHNFIHFSSAKFRKQPTKPSQNLWNSLKQFGRYRCSRQKLSMEISKSIRLTSMIHPLFMARHSGNRSMSLQHGCLTSHVAKVADGTVCPKLRRSKLLISGLWDRSLCHLNLI